MKVGTRPTGRAYDYEEWAANREWVIEGQYIRRAWLIPEVDGQAGPVVVLEFDGGIKVQTSAFGDCCSSAFVQHVCYSEALTDATVTKLEPLETMPVEWSASESVGGWGLRIHTTRGICNIECRLEHNGYYSGTIEWAWLDALPIDAKPLEDF